MRPCPCGAVLDTMGAIPPGAVALVSFAPFSGADAALVAAVLTVATYCMVFRYYNLR